ncbi:gamma-glutamylcyclotransferase [Pacificispira sp.]|uniref:gamma-glutamylcyclotransferase n=1 Tax=Pacificispira sp. TaxID=2888761 RepID=UPI003BA914BB
MSISSKHPIPPLPDFPRLAESEIDAQADEWARSCPAPSAVWIFATGSLIWNPEIPYVERRRAAIEGWHRALCLYSVHFRGTCERPGLVMGLAPGGHCEGCAFRIDPDRLEEAARILWRREMGHGSYRLIPLRAKTDQGEIDCYSFTPCPDHPQCAFDLPEDVIEETVRSASGERGPNIDYVLNTVTHLDELGIHDPALHRLAAKLTGATRKETA